MMKAFKTVAACCMVGALFLELISDDIKGLMIKQEDPSKPLETAQSLMTARNPVPVDSFCVQWQVNTDEWWTHHPEWYNTHNNDTYTCFSRRTDEEAQLYLRIYENQWQNDCSKVYTKIMWCSGWGADFINVVHGLQNAVDYGRPLAMQVYDDHGWHYAANKKDASNPTCPKKDLSCYFLPISACEAQPKKLADSNYPTVTAETERKYVPVYNYLTRPQQWLRREIYDFVKKLEKEIVAPCAVMHVRRADVVLHGESSRKYYPVSAYVDKLPEDRRQHIFLLTDDADAIDEAHEFYPKINWHYIDRPRFRGAEGGWENQTPSKNPKQEVVTILGTFQLAQRCDTLVHGSSVFSDELYRAMMQSGHDVNRLRVDEKEKGAFGAHNKDSPDELKKILDKQRKNLGKTSSGNNKEEEEEAEEAKEEDKEDEEETEDEQKDEEEEEVKEEDEDEDEQKEDEEEDNTQEEEPSNEEEEEESAQDEEQPEEEDEDEEAEQPEEGEGEEAEQQAEDEGEEAEQPEEEETSEEQESSKEDQPKEEDEPKEEEQQPTEGDKAAPEEEDKEEEESTEEENPEKEDEEDNEKPKKEKKSKEEQKQPEEDDKEEKKKKEKSKEKEEPKEEEQPAEDKDEKPRKETKNKDDEADGDSKEGTTDSKEEGSNKKKDETAFKRKESTKEE